MAQLRKSAQQVKEGKIITKTMINNYVKHFIITAPEKKKYNK